MAPELVGEHEIDLQLTAQVRQACGDVPRTTPSRLVQWLVESRWLLLAIAAVCALIVVVTFWLGDVFPHHGRAYLVSSLLLAFLVVALAIWYLPGRDQRAFHDAGVMEPDKLADLRLSSRTSVVQAVGGFALIATLAITAYQAHQASKTAATNIRIADHNARIAEEGQVTDRLSKAIDELGAKTVDARVGALFELKRIGEDSHRDIPPLTLIIGSYIASHLGHTGRPISVGRPCSRKRQMLRREPGRDVQMALQFVLPELNSILQRDGGITVLDQVNFNNMILSLTEQGAQFENIAMEGASFRNVDLRHATFKHVIIHGDFRGSCLEYAKFSDFGGNLDLRDTDLQFARFADLRGSINLSGADLSHAHVPRNFFKHAVYDHRTQRDHITYK